MLVFASGGCVSSDVGDNLSWSGEVDGESMLMTGRLGTSASASAPVTITAEKGH
jgi:hypothetical protein